MVLAGWNATDFLVSDFGQGRIAVFDDSFTFRHYLDNDFPSVTGMDFLPNGNLVAAAQSTPPEVRQYDPAGNLVGSFTDAGLGTPFDIKASADNLLYVGPEDASLGVSEFDLNGNLLRNLGAAAYSGIAVLPSGEVWAGSFNRMGFIDVYDIATGTLTTSITLDGGQTSATSMNVGSVVSIDLLSRDVYERDTSGNLVQTYTGVPLGTSLLATFASASNVFATGFGSSPTIFQWDKGSGSLTDSIDVSGAVDIAYGIAQAASTTAPNNPPNAVSDLPFSTDEDTVLTVPAPGVLANDSDPDAGDTISITAFDSTSLMGAAVTVNADGSFTYDPTGSAALQALDAGQVTTDFFNYTISDVAGLTDTAMVLFTIQGVDDPPTVDAGPSATIDEGATFLSAGSFTDPDSASHTATVDYGDGSGLQTLPLNADSTFSLSHTYVNDGVFTVTVTITGDDGGVGTDTTVVTVNDVAPNQPPVLDPVGDRILSGFNSHEFTVFVSDPDTPLNQLIFNATTTNKLLELDEQFDFVRTGRDFHDWGGMNEKWIFGNGGSNWYFITPAGELFQWDGSPRTNLSGTLIDNVGRAAYDDPSLLTDPSPAVPVDSVNVTNNGDGTATVLIDPQDNYLGCFDLTISVSDGLDSDNETVTITVRDGANAPMIALIADQTFFNTDAQQVGASFTDTDTSAGGVTLSVTGTSIAFVLDNIYGLAPDPGGDARDLLGLNERHFDGVLNQFGTTSYFITPSGEVYAWNDETGAGNQAVLLDTPGPFYHANLDELLSASPDAPTDALSVANNNDNTATITVDPNDSFEGTFLVSLDAADGIYFDSQGFRYTVDINNPPVATNDGPFSTDEDTPIVSTASLLTNDSDPDAGGTISVTAFDATSAMGAAVTVNPNGTFTYDPTASTTLQALNDGQTATDTFTYTISDSAGLMDTATVTMTVMGENDPPTAEPVGPQTVREGGRLVVPVYFFDSDSGVLTIDVSGLPGFATFEVTTGGPDASPTGGYSLRDQSSIPGLFGAFEDISSTGALVTSGDNNAGVINLQQSFDFFGQSVDSFTVSTNGYLSTDPTDDGGDFTNDPTLPTTPDIGGGGRIYPLHDDLFSLGVFVEFRADHPNPNGGAEPATIIMWDDVNFVGDANAFDMELILFHNSGDILMFIGDGVPNAVTPTVGIQREDANAALVYAADGAPASLNETALFFQPPPAGDVTVIGSFDVTPSFTDAGNYPIFIQATDQTGLTANQSFDLTVLDLTANLAVALTVDNPTPSLGGDVTFTVTVTNDGPDDTFGVEVTNLLPGGVTFVSANPSAGSFDPATGVWDDFDLVDGAIATLDVTATVNLTSPITVTAILTDSGAATDTDSSDDSDELTITVEEQDANRPPVAVDDAVSLDDIPGSLGGFILIDVLGNDTDADGDMLTIISVSDPTFGTVEIAGGEIAYDVDLSHIGETDTFTYTISDNKGGTSTATVTVEIDPTFIPAFTARREFTMNAGATLNGHARDGNINLDYTLIRSPEVGIFNLAEDGNFTYTAPPDVAGVVSFLYGTELEPGIVYITINNENPVTVLEGQMADNTLSIAGDPVDVLEFVDLDYDGITFDEDTTGSSFMLDASGVDGPASFLLGLRFINIFTGDTHVATNPLDVLNVPPALDVSPAGTITVSQGDDVNVTIDVTDPGQDDVTVTIDWDDGTQDTSTVLGGNGSVDGNHLFTTPGERMVTVTADDGDGGVTTEEVPVIVTVPPDAGLDFGDALGTGFPTRLADDGARHTPTGAQLGPVRDAELDGQPTSGADGDDNNPSGGPDDEDGLVAHQIAIGCGGYIELDVRGVTNPVFVNAWIDFNQNGHWDDPDERITRGAMGGMPVPSIQIAQSGNHRIGFLVPDDLALGQKPARIRVSSTDVLNPGGPAGDGEVEDHLVEITGRPSVVYVDDDFSSKQLGEDPDGDGPAIALGFDAFATIQDGVDCVAEHGSVQVMEGTYAESVNVHKTVSVTGQGRLRPRVLPPDGDGIIIGDDNVVIAFLNPSEGKNGVRADNVANVTLVDIISSRNQGAGFLGSNLTGKVSISGGTYHLNRTQGIELTDVEDIELNEIAVRLNENIGVFVRKATSFKDQGTSISSNDNDGLRLLEISGDATLTRTRIIVNGGDGLFAGTGPSGSVAIGGDLLLESVSASFGHQRGIVVDGVGGDAKFSFVDVIDNDDGAGVILENFKTATFTQGNYRLNKMGIQLIGPGAAARLSQVTAEANQDGNIAVEELDSLIIEASSFGSSMGIGMDISDIGPGGVALTDVNANENVGSGIQIESVEGPVTITDTTADENTFAFSGVEANLLIRVTGPLAIRGGSFSDAREGRGIVIEDILGAVVLNDVIADENDKGNLEIRRARVATIDGGSFSRAGEVGIHIESIFENILLAEVVADGNEMTNLNILFRFGSGFMPDATISIQGGSFSDSTNARGIEIDTNRNLTLSGVAANQNDETNLFIEDARTVIVTGGSYNESRVRGLNLLRIQHSVTISNVTANGNVLTNLTAFTLDNAEALVIDGGSFSNSTQSNGILIDAAKGSTSTLKNVTANGNRLNGLFTSRSGDLHISDGSFSNNGNEGIELFNPSRVELIDVKVNNNGFEGLQLFGVQRSSIDLRNSTFDDNGEQGIFLLVGTAGQAFGIDGSVNVTGVSASMNGDHGLFVQNADDVSLQGGIFSRNQQNGIHLVQVEDVLGINVRAQMNQADGVSIEDADDVEFSGGSVAGNAFRGFRIKNADDITTQNVQGSANLNLDGDNDPGLFIDGAVSYTDLGSHFSDNFNGGLYLFNISGDVMLTDTIAGGNDANGDGVGDGIHLENIGGLVTLDGVIADGNIDGVYFGPGVAAAIRASSFHQNQVGIHADGARTGLTNTEALQNLVADILAENGGTTVTLTAAIDRTINEGDTVLLAREFVGPLDRRHTVEVDWGDGVVETLSLPAGAQEYTIDHKYVDDRPSGTPQDAYPLRVTVRDEQDVIRDQTLQTVTVTNVPPTVTLLAVAPATLPGGTQATLSGAFVDPGAGDTHLLDVDWNGDGLFDDQGLPVSGRTFAFGHVFDLSPGDYDVSVRLRDDDGGATSAAVRVVITEPPEQNFVQAAHFFYNNSAHDGNGPAVTEDDFAAIATDKVPLLPGGTSMGANISGFSRGINGLFIDFADLPDDGAGVGADDFVFRVGDDDFPDTWAIGPAPTAIGVFPNAAPAGGDRVYITFADGAVADTWLGVTVLATAVTGLAADDTFYFGSARGETGAGFTPGVVGVDAADLQSIAQNRTPLADAGSEPVLQVNDLNRDGTVDAFDFQVVAVNLDPNVIRLISPQSAAAAVAERLAAEETAVEGFAEESPASPGGATATDGGADQRVGHEEETDRDLAFATFDDSTLGALGDLIGQIAQTLV